MTRHTIATATLILSMMIGGMAHAQYVGTIPNVPSTWPTPDATGTDDTVTQDSTILPDG